MKKISIWVVSSDNKAEKTYSNNPDDIKKFCREITKNISDEIFECRKKQKRLLQKIFEYKNNNKIK